MFSCTPGKDSQRCLEHKNRCTNGDRHYNDSSEQGFSDKRLVTELFLHSDLRLGVRSFGKNVDVAISKSG